MARTLASFLADLPEDQLRGMLEGGNDARTRIREEDVRLQVEEQLITAALARKGRRTTGQESGGGRLTRGQVLRVLQHTERPLRAAEAILAVQTELGGGSAASVRAHLHRLVQEGKLKRDSNLYSIAQSTSDRDQTSANGSSPEADAREIGLEGRAPGAEPGNPFESDREG